MKPEPRGRPKAGLKVTKKERESLEQWAQRPETARGPAVRARIVLHCSSGATNTAVAARLHVSRQMVCKWRARFVARRLDGLLDEPRPGAPRRFDDAAVKRVLTKTLESVPRDATHWSTRHMARASGMSQSTVGRIWRAFGFHPYRNKAFKLSEDPLFIAKVRDMVGLYLSPTQRALVLCVDEKSQVQAFDRSQPLRPKRPGQVDRQTNDYGRHENTPLSVALNYISGEVVSECHRRHHPIEFREFLRAIDASVPLALDVHLILDNSSTRKTALIKRWLVERPRFHVHVTPTSASWLDQVERWFLILKDTQLRCGNPHSMQGLEIAIISYLSATNTDPCPFIWTRTAEEILAILARFRERGSDSE